MCVSTKAVVGFADTLAYRCGVDVYSLLLILLIRSPIGCRVGVYKAVADFVDTLAYWLQG